MSLDRQQFWAPAQPECNYQVGLARGADQIREAQRLRFKVLVEERGAPPPDRLTNRDIDRFDFDCDQLIVRALDSAQIVATYRILPPESAARLGGIHADREFQLDRLDPMRERLVEVGCRCIHPRHLCSEVIDLLWSGLADYMGRRGYEYLACCVSVSVRDGGRNVANLYAGLPAERLAPPDLQVFPFRRLPREWLADGAVGRVPSRLADLLQAGAWVCGEPAWDPAFGSAELFLLMPLSRIRRRCPSREVHQVDLAGEAR